MAIGAHSRSLSDPLADKLGYQLRRASLCYMATLTAAMDALDLKVTEATILMFVAANPGCSQGEISRALKVKRTNMVPTVNSLAARGLILRRATDGRTNALILTESGAALHSAVLEAIDLCEQKFFGEFDRATTVALSKGLVEIRRRGDD